MKLRVSIFLFCIFFATILFAYQPLGKTAYLTSSFGESRGTRYHVGIDFSTNMEEGWPIIAPSDGTVILAARGPFGYGRYLKFKSKDDHTWVFAHLSEFCPKLDSLIHKEMLKKKKPNVSISIRIPFKKGDTLAYSGSTGIGNPHLHIERRTEDEVALNPCKPMECPDTVKPLLLGLDTAFGGIAFKIADYSREPFENPMSVKKIQILQVKRIVFSKSYDSIFVDTKKAPKIREDLLWSERTDEFGDWHFIPISLKKLQPLSGFKFVAYDFAGNFSEVSFASLKEPAYKIKHQDSSLYTFLSKVHPRAAVDSLLKVGNAKLLSKENERLEGGGVSQSFRGLSKTFLPNTAAWRKTKDNVFEFHPKGLQLDSWELCLDTAIAPHPLYWRGETTRKWFLFGKQSLNSGKRCVRANELRDIASFLDTVPPSFGKVYVKEDFMGKAICRIPVLDSLSGLDFGSVDFRDKNGNWVVFDYDSDPEELFVERRDFDFKEPLSIKFCDEAGNCASKEITCSR